MDPDQLQQYLDQGLSLRQIANLAGCDPSTVGHWAEKYALVANGRAQQACRGLSREYLEQLIERAATAREMADVMDVSESTVRYWLKKYGLRTNNGVGRKAEGSRSQIARGHWSLPTARRDRASARGPRVLSMQEMPCRGCVSTAPEGQASAGARGGRPVRDVRLRPLLTSTAISPLRSVAEDVWHRDARRHAVS
jgi:transposase